MINARLRQRITFLAKVTTQDQTTGSLTEAWQTFAASVPAEVLTGPGFKPEKGDALRSDIKARITTRWFPADYQTLRVQWDGHLFDITSWMSDEKGREWLRFECVDINRA